MIKNQIELKATKSKKGCKVMDKKYYCKDCVAFKNWNYCELYDTNTFPNTIACSKYKAKEPESSEKESSVEQVDDAENIDSNTELPINNSKGIFNGPFLPTGRIRRLEFGISLLVYFLGGFCINLAINSGTSDEIQIILFKIVDYALLIWYLFQSIKRCHDLGDSGWYVLIPIFNPFALLLLKGEDGINEYGSNPKHNYDEQLRNDPVYGEEFNSGLSTNTEVIDKLQEANDSKGDSSINEVALPDLIEESSSNPIKNEEPEITERSSKKPILICCLVILVLVIVVLGFKLRGHENATSVSSLYNDSSFQENNNSIAEEAGNQIIDESELEEGEETDGIIIFTPPKGFKVEKEKDDSTNAYTFHLSYDYDDIYILGDYYMSFTIEDFEQVCVVWEDNSVKDVKGIKRAVTVDKQYQTDNGSKIFQKQVVYKGGATAYWDIAVIFNQENSKVALVSEYRIGSKPHINEIVNSIKFR